MTGAEEQAIVDIIEEFIKSEVMFTAFDVTKEARNRGAQAIHGQTKGIVYSHQFPRSYTKTIIPVPGAPINPFLYHLKGADISSYKQGKIDISQPVVKVTPKVVPVTLTSDAKKDISTQNSTQSLANRAGLFQSTLARLGFIKNPLSNLLPTPTFKTNSGFIVNLDARGRYIMRASVITAAGLFQGDQVFMYINPVAKEILLIKSDAQTLPKATKATAMRVDKDNNLLIFKTYITRAFGTIPAKFVFTTDKNQITIKAE